MTVSVENFVKTIYIQGKISGGNTKLSTIAGLLSISKAAATDMARKMALKNLVNYTKYKPLALTSAGKKLALSVIRKHRLWGIFFYIKHLIYPCTKYTGRLRYLSILLLIFLPIELMIF
jgi:DtxR family Mn-dependent transcriptional regulator